MKCYTVAGYECAFAPTYNRVAVHAASLDIDRKLTADPLTDDGTIPKTYFNFLPYEQLSTKLLKNQQLTDYIGRVEDLEWAEIQKTNSVLRMKVTTPGCKPVTVALWKEIHLPLDMSLITDVDEEVIVAFTALKVMPQQSGLQLQSSGGTRVIINPQIPLAQEMAERFRAARMGTPVSKITLRSITPVDRISESDITTIGHLYQQDIQALQSLHTVEATITEFTEARGWFFVNCTACGCRIYEKDSVYSCDKHKQQHLSYSYSVNCTVEDDTGTANVTIFDKGILTMIGIKCYDMIAVHGFTKSKELPGPVAEQKGTKWLLQLKKGQKNTDNMLRFTANSVLSVDKKILAALPPIEGKGKAPLCITDGQDSKARRELFTEHAYGFDDETNPGPVTEAPSDTPKRKLPPNEGESETTTITDANPTARDKRVRLRTSIKKEQ